MSLTLTCKPCGHHQLGGASVRTSSEAGETEAHGPGVAAQAPATALRSHLFQDSYSAWSSVQSLGVLLRVCRTPGCCWPLRPSRVRLTVGSGSLAREPSPRGAFAAGFCKMSTSLQGRPIYCPLADTWGTPYMDYAGPVRVVYRMDCLWGGVHLTAARVRPCQLQPEGKKHSRPQETGTGSSVVTVVGSSGLQPDEEQHPSSTTALLCGPGPLTPPLWAHL